ncbi:protein of unknown function DUF4220 [Dillenia turbinata]|uniref:DUF4220 domain-containing protein n=1 Tax=Dillenia turbinata TaxID=194707 RepID=A0AAN8YQW2_9MAGN
MQIFPERVRLLWNDWELRVTVVLSLCLQVVLIIFGNRRKFTTRNWVRVILWMAYLSADWIATISLGILAQNQGDSPDANALITAFWAPFLLIHLGGPDTVTAYSLEDNELWLRHFLGLIVQVGVAFYIFLRSWTTHRLTFLALPIYVAGIVKYGERTWVLRSASNEQFRDSLLPPPDPGPDYVKLMEEFNSRKAQGLDVSYQTVIETPKLHEVKGNTIPEAKLLHEAFFLFNMLKRLFASLILSMKIREDCMSIVKFKSALDAFRIVEVELGLMYDVLYTKASVVYTRLGVFLRLVTFLSSLSALVAFRVMINEHDYSKIDTSISYLLLVGAIALEIYAVFLLIRTDWCLFWLSKQKNSLAIFFYRVLFSSRLALISNRRWSESMGQFNLIKVCLKDNPPPKHDWVMTSFFSIREMIERHRYKTLETVSIQLKELVFNQLHSKSNTCQSSEDFKKFCSRRGDYVLEINNCIDEFRWSVTDVELDHSILLWHVATNLCYYSDMQRLEEGDLDSKCKIGKSFSDYMMYILVWRPFMLPKGIGQTRYRDTCAEARRYFDKRRESIAIDNITQACMALLEVSTEIPPSAVKGDRSKSVLFEGCILAKSLQSLETGECWGRERKWEMICDVWVEILCYAAGQCEWNVHAQQLRRGGELLTLVSLLMAHLGFSEQYQISQGHATVKFNSSLYPN